MKFIFQAKTATGELIEGNIEAPNQDRAISILQGKNLIVIELEIAPSSFAQRDIMAFFNRPKRRDIVVFTRQLATLVGADVPLLDALSTLVKQTEKESFKRIIATVAASVEGGAPLSVALAEHERTFDNFYVSLVRVGEVSGRLQETLNYLADYLERTSELISKVRGAMAYPIFVLIAMIVITTVLMATVIPEMLSLVQEVGVNDLPFTTKLLIFVSDLLRNHILVLLVVLIAIITGLYYYVRTERGRFNFDKFLISIPKFGVIAQNVYIARFSETLATLIRAGVPILEGLAITADVVGNKVYEQILLDSRKNVQAGGSISEAFLLYDEIPSLVGAMLQTGEKTGKSAEMLTSILKYYRSQAEASIANISQLIEPVLMLIVGAGVGILVSAVLLPIFNLSGSIG